MEHSESIANLAAALSAYQATACNPANSAKNPFLKNKYAPLNAILTEVRPELAKHGLALSQLVTGVDKIGVTSMLMHSSGEWIADTVMLTPDSSKGLSTAQNAGVVITYLRRYAVQAILGISGEDDTDGHADHPRKEDNTKPLVNKKQEAVDYSLMDPANMSATDAAGAIRQELQYLDEHAKAAAAEYREVANGIKEDTATPTERLNQYRELIADMRQTRLAHEAKTEGDAYKDKEPKDEQEIF